MKDGWQVRSLAEIADCCLGKMLDKAKNRGTPRPYLRNVNVRWFDFDLSDVLEMPFEDSERERYTARRGDLLICEGGYPGRAAIWDRDERIYFQKAVHRLRFHEPERARWVLYYLWASDADGSLKRHFTGSGIQHLTGQAVAGLKIPLPPLEEQRQILTVLDEAFSAIDIASANAKTSLANSRAVGQRALHSLLSPAEDNWYDVAIGDVADIQSGVGFPEHFQGEKDQAYPFFKVGDMNSPGNEITMAVVNHTISEETRVRLGARLFPVGSVVFPKVGGAIATDKKRVVGRECCVDNNVMGVVPKPDLLDATLLHQLLVNKPLSDFANDAGLPSIRKSTVAEWRVRIPREIAEQKRLARHLSALADSVRELTEVYRAKLRLQVELKRSLLRRAFSGEPFVETSRAA